MTPFKVKTQLTIRYRWLWLADIHCSRRKNWRRRCDRNLRSDCSCCRIRWSLDLVRLVNRCRICFTRTRLTWVSSDWSRASRWFWKDNIRTMNKLQIAYHKHVELERMSYFTNEIHFSFRLTKKKLQLLLFLHFLWCFLLTLHFFRLWYDDFLPK